MGITYVDIELVCGDDLALLRRGYMQPEQVRSLTVKALVDSGASLLTIPPSIRTQLALSTLDTQQAELADGSVITVDVAGPVENSIRESHSHGHGPSAAG